MKLSLPIFILACLAGGPAFSQTTLVPRPFLAENLENACSAVRRAEVSARLEVIRGIDQGSRQSGTVNADLMPRTDLENRQEVAALFAEGCFTKGRDYHNAALVFQHGTVPEHYYQAYIWASRAVELGDMEAKWLIPRAIDRFALNSGYKQLFATNLVVESYFSEVTEASQKTWCVWPSSRSITDRRRVAMGVATQQAVIERAKSMTHAPFVSKGICPTVVPDMPRGLFPGIW